MQGVGPGRLTFAKLGMQRLQRRGKPGYGQMAAALGRVSTVVVQRFCKPKVGGSNPSPGTSIVAHMNRIGFRRPTLILGGLLAALWLAAPCPAAASDLYEGEAIVSGTVLETRSDGLAQCLRHVLVKLSGNPALADDPRVDALGAKAATLLDSLAYIDRMSDSPHHDEQGTRDRPFTLIARFDPARTDAALARLGEHPWRGVRPVLAIDIMVHDHGADYPMTADGDNGERQREALLAAARLYGMVVALPATMGEPKQPGGIKLHGTLRWSDAESGWVGQWRMGWRGGEHDWGIRGVSFDDAFRNAVAGAMALLSGHGPPHHK